MAAQPVTGPVHHSDKIESKNDNPKVNSLYQESELSHSSDVPKVDQQFALNPFTDPAVAEHYRQVYEKAKYECRHVFDPDLEWTPKEERKLVWKIDWHVCLWACVMFLALEVDRSNLKQAVSDDMLDQLGLSTNEYNYGTAPLKVTLSSVYLLWLRSFHLSLSPNGWGQIGKYPFFVVSAALVSDLPVTLKADFPRWIPMQMVLWSIVASAQAGLTNKSTFYACRALLGLLQGGFIPDLVLWLSYFYTSRELPTRLSFFWFASGGTDILTSLLAFALLHLNGVHNLAGWRWLFMIEGIITFAVGVAACFLMPASAVQTKTWYRPKGWFSDREVGIVVNRVLRDDPSKGDMHNREPIVPKRLWQALVDYDMWPIYLLGLVIFLPKVPVDYYLTLSLRHVGFSPFDANLLTIPSAFGNMLTLLAVTWLSEQLNERGFASSLQNLWILPCVICLRFWPGVNVDAWGTFALITVYLSYPYCHAIIVAWTSKNSGSVRTRSVSAAVYNMAVQAGNVVGSNIYRTDDKPLYHRGNSTLLALNILAIALIWGTKFYYMWKNRVRAAKWDKMTEDEREEYVKNTTDQGNKRLDFRFAH